nr:hypothetical protein Iba_chr12aCG21740 [Ipomoea batatas]
MARYESLLGKGFPVEIADTAKSALGCFSVTSKKSYHLTHWPRTFSGDAPRLMSGVPMQEEVNLEPVSPFLIKISEVIPFFPHFTMTLSIQMRVRGFKESTSIINAFRCCGGSDTSPLKISVGQGNRKMRKNTKDLGHGWEIESSKIEYAEYMFQSQGEQGNSAVNALLSPRNSTNSESQKPSLLFEI